MAFAARNSIYIRNLGPKVSEATLRETFGQCDKIERVLFRSFNGRTTEFFAQVDFASSKGVLEAHTLSGTKIAGTPIEVSVMDPGANDVAKKAWLAQKPWETVPEDQQEAATEPQGVQAEYFRKFKEKEEDKRLRTVHIAGLAKDVGEENVRILCKQFGELEALRLDEDDAGNVFALVEFKERGPAHVVKTQEKFMVDDRVVTFTEARTLVNVTAFAEESVAFDQPAYDPTTMRVVHAVQVKLNPKIAKAKLAAAQIAGEEVSQELIDAANDVQPEEEPIVWEGRGEKSAPLEAKRASPPKDVRDDRDTKRRRGDSRARDSRERSLERRKRRRDGRDDSREHSGRGRGRGREQRSPPRRRRSRWEKEDEAGSREAAAAKALGELEKKDAPEDDDEVETVPNTELVVLGESESSSEYEEGPEGDAARERKAKEKEEKKRAAEEAKKAEEDRKAEEARKAEEERIAAEKKEEEERKAAEEAKKEALRKAKEDEISVVKTSSQEFIQAALQRKRLERLASQEDAPKKKRWECEKCGEVNKPEREFCNNCGARAPWRPEELEVNEEDDAESSSSESPPPPPSPAKSIAESAPRSVAESPPRSIAGSSPRSIPDDEQVEIDDEPEKGGFISESDDGEVQVESERISGELAEARARIYHGSPED
eukprot:TRINITY_DN52418_c0_g1_i1.p1 TRINITY_DN52418_c0_g1~~TRINITY_DN52418_c0_g1_i1.p1  ORF type:complete len:658 (-),score=205.18 TRINITY_DN52418_c0_g1_i1:67-2040(-)